MLFFYYRKRTNPIFIISKPNFFHFYRLFHCHFGNFLHSVEELLRLPALLARKVNLLELQEHSVASRNTQMLGIGTDVTCLEAFGSLFRCL